MQNYYEQYDRDKTDMMMTKTVMEDVVEEDVHVINTRSTHHTIANHTTVHTGTNKKTV